MPGALRDYTADDAPHRRGRRGRHGAAGVDRMGGDSTNVYVPPMADVHGARPVDLSRDIGAIENALEDLRPELVVIDPISAFLGHTDSHKDSEVRSVLAAAQRPSACRRRGTPARRPCALSGPSHEGFSNLRQTHTSLPSMYRLTTSYRKRDRSGPRRLRRIGQSRHLPADDAPIAASRGDGGSVSRPYAQGTNTPSRERVGHGYARAQELRRLFTCQADGKPVERKRKAVAENLDERFLSRPALEKRRTPLGRVERLERLAFGTREEMARERDDFDRPFFLDIDADVASQRDGEQSNFTGV